MGLWFWMASPESGFQIAGARAIAIRIQLAIELVLGAATLIGPELMDFIGCEAAGVFDWVAKPTARCLAKPAWTAPRFGSAKPMPGLGAYFDELSELSYQYLMSKPAFYSERYQ